MSRIVFVAATQVSQVPAAIILDEERLCIGRSGENILELLIQDHGKQEVARRALFEVDRGFRAFGLFLNQMPSLKPEDVDLADGDLLVCFVPDGHMLAAQLLFAADSQWRQEINEAQRLLATPFMRRAANDDY